MHTCSNCGKEISENLKFCGYCGAKAIKKKYCDVCGEEIPSEFAFCTNCGAPAKCDVEVPIAEAEYTVSTTKEENELVQKVFDFSDKGGEKTEGLKDGALPSAEAENNNEVQQNVVFAETEIKEITDQHNVIDNREIEIAVEDISVSLEKEKNKSCPNCGKAVPDNYVYCPKCGISFLEDKKSRQNKTGKLIGDDKGSKPKNRGMTILLSITIVILVILAIVAIGRLFLIGGNNVEKETLLPYIEGNILYTIIDENEEYKVDSNVVEIIKVLETGEIYYVKSLESFKFADYFYDSHPSADPVTELPIEPVWPSSEFENRSEYMAAYNQYTLNKLSYENWQRIQTILSAIEDTNLEYQTYALCYYDGIETTTLINGFLGNYNFELSEDTSSFVFGSQVPDDRKIDIRKIHDIKEVLALAEEVNQIDESKMIVCFINDGIALSSNMLYEEVVQLYHFLN